MTCKQLSVVSNHADGSRVTYPAVLALMHGGAGSQARFLLLGENNFASLQSCLEGWQARSRLRERYRSGFLGTEVVDYRLRVVVETSGEKFLGGI